MPSEPAKRSRKRANGEGSIFKEANGRYRVAVTKIINGKTVRKTATAWKYAVAVEHLNRLRNEQPDNRTDLKTVWSLIDRWMEMRVRPMKKRSQGADGKDEIVEIDRKSKGTCKNREATCKNHLKPYFKGIALKGFSIANVEDFVKHLLGYGAGSGTIESCWEICRCSFKYGMVIKAVSENPFTLAEKPKSTKKKMNPFSAEEVRVILKYTEKTKWHAFYHVAFHTGARQGELFGLRWANVNLKEKWIYIEEQAVEVCGVVHITAPKTTHSIRKVGIPDVVVSALNDHKAILLKKGLGGNPLVFPNRAGRVQRRSGFWKMHWKPLLKNLDIHHRGAHNTRHTYATLALGENAPIAAVSKILGHANVSTTLNTYAHSMPNHETQVVEIVARLFA